MPRNSVWVEEKDCVKEIVVITDDVSEIDHGPWPLFFGTVKDGFRRRQCRYFDSIFQVPGSRAHLPTQVSPSRKSEYRFRREIWQLQG